MNVALHPPTIRPMTQAEFFAWAERQDGRYEFDGTKPVAMTGGTNNHGLIAGNLLFELMSRLRGGPCTPMLPEGGGVATTGNRVRYPDVAVTCSPIPGRARLVPNPVVVFEVLSPSSVRNDRVFKLADYLAVPSIQRYVLIEQGSIGLAVHARHGTAWMTTPLLEGTLSLPELGIDLPVASLYMGVTFDDDAAESPAVPA